MIQQKQNKWWDFGKRFNIFSKKSEQISSIFEPNILLKRNSQNFKHSGIQTPDISDILSEKQTGRSTNNLINQVDRRYEQESFNQGCNESLMTIGQQEHQQPKFYAENFPKNQNTTRFKMNYNRQFLKSKEQKKNILQQKNNKQRNFQQLRQKQEDLYQQNQNQGQQEQQYIPINGLLILYQSRESTYHITDKNLLVKSILPPGIILQCKITRSSNWTKLIKQQYHLFLKKNNQHLLSAQRVSVNGKEVFKISNDSELWTDHTILAGIYANKLHNEYWIVKLNQSDGKDVNNSEQLKKCRCYIKYKNFNKKLKTREMQVRFPSPNIQFQINIKVPVPKNSQCNEEKYFNFPLNRLEGWETKLQKSDKNFVLVDNEDTQYHYLKMQKQSTHAFKLQIQHPLSILDSFAISLTRFDAQLS